MSVMFISVFRDVVCLFRTILGPSVLLESPRSQLALSGIPRCNFHSWWHSPIPLIRWQLESPRDFDKASPQRLRPSLRAVRRSRRCPPPPRLTPPRSTPSSSSSGRSTRRRTRPRRPRRPRSPPPRRGKRARSWSRGRPCPTQWSCTQVLWTLPLSWFLLWFCFPHVSSGFFWHFLTALLDTWGSIPHPAHCNDTSSADVTVKQEMWIIQKKPIN